MTLIFVDCEGHGPAAGLNDHEKFEVGAVERKTLQTFHGIGGYARTFQDFREWLTQFKGRPIFVSDNPAYDWQFVNYYFHLYGDCIGWNCTCNPFGHSARRIGDFYAGLLNNWYETQRWKGLRVTKHDHNPVHDAMGNLEAFERLLKGER